MIKQMLKKLGVIGEDVAATRAALDHTRVHTAHEINRLDSQQKTNEANLAGLQAELDVYRRARPAERSS